MTSRILHVLFALAALAAILGLSQNAHAFNDKHDCTFCHMLHNAPGQTLLDNAVVETLCLTCHGVAGPPEIPEVGLHVVDGGSTTMSCMDCHEPHSNPENWLLGNNLTLVKEVITTPNSGDREVVFESRGTDAGQAYRYSFADNNDDGLDSPLGHAYDGVCEVCHTSTDHHLNTGDPFVAGHQNRGRTCTDCHPHLDGFLPTGGDCTACHNSAQDNLDGVPPSGRRAIIPEFSMTSFHLDGGSLDAADCEICHDQTGHQDGNVHLKDADGGASITLDGTIVTVNSSVESAKLNAFCLACHGDGLAGASSTPFTTGATIPVAIDSATWTNFSSHNVIGNMSCYGNGSTTGCHNSGHGSEKVKLLAPYDVAPTGPAYTEEQEGFCFTCHDSDGPAGTDIENLFTLSPRHRVHYADQTGTGRDAECTTCHDQHWVSATPAHSNDNLASGLIDAVGGVLSDGTTPVFPVVYEYELCFKCHANYSPGTSNAGDGGQDPVANKAAQFNTGNATFHPVVGAGNNQYTSPTLANGYTVTMEPPWNQTTDEHNTIHCTDCHLDAAVAGPHGGGDLTDNGFGLPIRPSMLIAPLQAQKYNPSTGLPDGSNRGKWVTPLCIRCHKISVYPGGDSGTYFGNHGTSSHIQPDWSGGYGGCLSCHFGGNSQVTFGDPGVLAAKKLTSGIHGGANTSNQNAIQYGGTIAPGFMNGSRQRNWAPGTCSVVPAGAWSGDSGCKNHTKTY